MKYGIVGNREGWDENFVLGVLRGQGITKKDTIITGGARGVDEIAEAFSKEIGCKLTVYRPDFNVAHPYRYHQRNKKIAKECDVLIAFDKKIYSGTSQTVRFAEELGKEVRKIYGGN